MRLILSILFLLVMALPAHAGNWSRQSRPAYTPGALAAESHRIVRVRVRELLFVPPVATTSAAAEPGIGTLEIRFQILETLKGPAAGGGGSDAEGVIGPYKMDRDDAGKLQVGQELLIAETETLPPPTWPLVVIAHLDSSQPSPDWSTWVVTNDLEPLDGPPLLAALREELRRPPGDKVLMLERPYSGYREPVAGRIEIADDDRLPALAAHWKTAPNPACQHFLINLLSQRDLPGRIDTLKQYLNDPAENDTSFTGPWTPRLHPLEDDARMALCKLGFPLKEVLSWEHKSITTQYARVPFAWPLLVVLGGLLGLYLVMRRLRFARRIHFFPSAIVSLAACVMLTLAWRRSTQIADDFEFASQPRLVCLSSYGGGIQVLWSSGVLGSTPLVHTTLKPFLDRHAFVPMLPNLGGEGIPFLPATPSTTPPSGRFWHFFGSADPDHKDVRHVTTISYSSTFSVDDPSEGGSGPFLTATRLVIPYFYLIGLFLLLPLFATSIWFAAARRLRHRLKHHLCLTCGYDLRAHLTGGAGEKCPECGTAYAAASK